MSTAAPRPCCSACAEARPAPARRALPVFPLFVVSSLGLALTLGVSTGLILLWRMAFASGTVLASHVQLHAHVQILGFAGLFVFGVALHALPRILGAPAPSRRLALTVLGGIGGGVLLRAIGQPLAPWAAGRLVSLLSGPAELLGAFAFASFALPILRARARDGDPLASHLLAGTLWLLVTAALSGGQALHLAGHADAELPSALTEPFYSVSLYGFLLSFILGFSSRMVPAFLGRQGPRFWGAPATLALQTAGLLAALGAALPGCPADAARLLGQVSALLLAGAVAAFLAASGLPGRTGDPALRAPFAALGLWALLSAGAAGFEIATSRLAHKFVWDGARHLFTLGVLTLLILVMSARVVPAFSGRPLGAPRAMRGAILLVATGALLRFLLVPVGVGIGGLPLYRLVAFSGIAVAAGLLLFGWVLFRTFRPGVRSGPLALPTRPG